MTKILSQKILGQKVCQKIMKKLAFDKKTKKLRDLSLNAFFVEQVDRSKLIEEEATGGDTERKLLLGLQLLSS